MTTEQEQAEGVIDVFGEAFMKLVRERLRLQVRAYHTDRGKVQVDIVLEDVGDIRANGARMVSDASFTLCTDLLVIDTRNTHYVPNPGRQG